MVDLEPRSRLHDMVTRGWSSALAEERLIDIVKKLDCVALKIDAIREEHAHINRLILKQGLGLAVFMIAATILIVLRLG